RHCAASVPSCVCAGQRTDTRSRWQGRRPLRFALVSRSGCNLCHAWDRSEFGTLLLFSKIKVGRRTCNACAVLITEDNKNIESQDSAHNGWKVFSIKLSSSPETP